jgi:hypothetical protein
VTATDVISVFWDGTTSHTLVHELGCEQLKTTRELLNISTRQASGEEVVESAFVLGNAKAAANGGRTAPYKATAKGARHGGKKG